MTNNQLTPENVTRFTQYGVDMMEWPDGAYVKYEDYAALAAELQERRKTEMGSEPVAYIDKQWTLVYYVPPMSMGLKIGDKLYRHAQQPVVPEEKPMPNPLSMYAVDAVAAIAEVKGWNACRAAMLQGAKNSESRVGIRTATALDSFKENADARCGNSPVIPEGYVMVPKEPTKEMIDAGWLHFMGTKNPSSKGTYKAMLAAAPQSIGSDPATVPGKWIPVSEHLPDPKSEQRVCVYTPTPHEDMRYRFVPASLFRAVCSDATHWYYMEPPAAPQEVPDGK